MPRVSERTVDTIMELHTALGVAGWEQHRIRRYILTVDRSALNRAVAVAAGWVPPNDPLIKELRKTINSTRRTFGGGDPIPRDTELWLPRRDLDARWTYSPPDFLNSWAMAGPLIDAEGITVERIEQADGTYLYRCPHVSMNDYANTYLHAALWGFLARRLGIM
jgi:hypothetical protein